MANKSIIRLGILLSCMALGGARLHAQEGAAITEQCSYPNSKKMVYFLKDIHDSKQCREENIGTVRGLVNHYNAKLLGLEAFDGEFDANMEMMFPPEQRESFRKKIVQETPYLELEFEYGNGLFTVGTDDISLNLKAAEPFKKMQKYCSEHGSKNINLSDTLNSKELRDMYHEWMNVQEGTIEGRSKASVDNIIKYMKKMKIDTAAQIWGGGHWESAKKALEDYNGKASDSEKISYAAIEVPSYAACKDKNNSKN